METASPERVEFESNLLGGFGAGFVTPVNTINFATVFDDIGQKLIDSVAVWTTIRSSAILWVVAMLWTGRPVWTTILAFLIIYIPFAVLARHLDKKDALKVQTCRNTDNIESALRYFTKRLFG